MIELMRFFGLNTMSAEIPTRKNEPIQKEVSLLNQNCIDTVSFTTNKSEKFADVRTELAQNVPDSTSTIEEKEKAISYIDRMLKCDDITPELKNYWANKKDIIQMEIQNIKNEQQQGKDKNYQNIVKEFYDFIDQHWCDNYPKERNQNLEFPDSEEYGLTFYNTCISYLNRILACEDLPDEEKSNFEQQINHWNAEKQSRLGELNWYQQNNNIKTESFYDVYAEFNNNIPDSTSTISEKKLASMYIKRMILCDDIPADLKEYWSNKRDIIEMELSSLRNSMTTQYDDTTTYKEIQEEFNDFTKKYWNKNPNFDNISDRVEYWVTYNRTCQSYIQRILECDGLPDNLRNEYMTEYSNHQFDINNQYKDLKIYQQEQK